MIVSEKVKAVFVELLNYAISFSITKEIHKNTTDISRVTNKHYYKTMPF